MFKLEAEQGKARAGVLKTAHGKISTPFFMPVATKGSVKLVSNEELLASGTECIICNGWIFSIRPGLSEVEKAGGIHRFIGWPKAVFTDSGGFQTLSEKFLISASDRGVSFRNPFDKSKAFLSPEKAVRMQNALQSDAAMCLDDVPVHGCSPERARESAERTLAWAKRCRAAHENREQLLFGICQGALERKLREKSAKDISELCFDGNAIGGLCIGEPEKQRLAMIEAANRFLPQDKPRYLMGVGSPKDLLQAISLGVDVFDSCFPARVARHSTAMTGQGNRSLESGKFRGDFSAIDSECGCFVCRNHSRAFVHHLLKAREENGQRLLSIHNISFVQSLLSEARAAIRENSFDMMLRKWKIRA